MATVKVGVIRYRVDQERSEALAVRDPLAISNSSERFKVVEETLAAYRDEQDIDLDKVYLSASQAARMLGYKSREVHLLLRQHKLVGYKEKNSKEWRVPLGACLLGR
jgi:hypothetical protein